MIYNFYTNLPPYETYQQLRYAALHDGNVDFELTRDSGVEDAELYLIKIRKLTAYSNSFSPVFYGEITPSESGSVIEGEFKMHHFVKAFFIFMMVVGLFPGLAGIPMRSSLDSILCNGLVFPTFIGLIFLFGRIWLGGMEEDYIKNFVGAAFQGKPKSKRKPAKSRIPNQGDQL
jgi:hypothetical protein